MKPWIEILLRSVSLFFISLFFVRIMGKSNISRISAFKFVNYIVIAVIASLISINIITNIAFGFIALGVWILLPIGLDYLSIKSKIIHDLINGKETIIIKNGKVLEKNLMSLRLTGEELLRSLRSKNAFNLADVEFAVMEPTGDINMLLKSDKKPITSYDMGKKVSPKSEARTVILDGNIINEPLTSMGFNQDWLKSKLEIMGVSVQNVFIGQVDSSGDLYVDLFDDVIHVPQPKVKEMLYANIEKCQADLMKYSLETQNKSARAMYSSDADKLKQLMENLEPYLLH